MLSSFTREIEKAIFDSEILRNHLTVEIRNPDGYKQSHRVFYRNKSNEKDDNNLRCIRLPARKKTVQRNLSVHDREGNSLAIIPSDRVHKALCEICKFYLNEAKKLAGNAYGSLFDKLIGKINFSKVFVYMGNPEKAQGILDDLMTFQSELRSKPLKSLDDILLYIRRTFYLVRIYQRFYIPVVKLEKPVAPRDCTFINYHIENLVKGPEQMRSSKLFAFGILNISIPLELEPTASNHIRILTPPGMVFSKAQIPEIPEYADLGQFMDDDMVYFHIPKEKAFEIMQKQKKKIAQKEGHIRIKIRIGISSKILEFSLIRALSFLMYISIFLPFIAFCFPWNGFKFGYPIIFDSVVLVLGILISLSVYSMDKRFLHDYLVGQIMILICILSIEVFLLINLCS